MKRILLLIAVLTSASFSFAQVPGGAPALTGRISGTVVDSLTQKPVDYATVSLGRTGSTKNTNGGITDEKGAFKIDNVAPGSYTVTIAFVGYKTKKVVEVKTSNEKLDINLGKILLAPTQESLQEVVVEGKAAVIENKVDRLVYNAEADVAIAGGTAADVLRKVPLLSVDMDGNLSLRGSQNVRVLINGKPSGAMANSVADAIRAIPADQIKSVEVITSPSSKYDAEGTSGIVNIITKKSNLQGISGSVNAGVGTRQNSGNLNLNANTGRLAITANGGGFYSWPQTSTISFNRVNTADGMILSQTGKSKGDRLATNGSIGADYDFNAYNSLSSTLRLNWFTTGVDGLNLSRTQIGNTIVDFNRDTENGVNFNGFDWNTGYLRKFKKQGQELSLGYQLSKSFQDQDYTSVFSNTPENEVGINNNEQSENTLQLDYVHPFKKVNLEIGGKMIMRDILSDVNTRLFNSSTGVTTPLPARTYDYDYQQDVYAAYASLGFTLGKVYTIKAGARYEGTDINGAMVGSSTGAFNSNYSNFVPSVVISRSFKNYSTLKLSYNQRIQRPGQFYLNPFRNSADVFNQQEGNPSLSPELSHNFELNYSMFVKTTVINGSVYYRRTNDIIESIVRPTTYTNPQTGVTQTVSLMTFDNVGHNNSVGFNGFIQVNPVKALTLRTNFNVFTYSINTNNSFASANANDEVYLQYNAFIMGSYNFPKGLVFETFLITNAPRRTAQGKNPSFNMWNLGLKKELFKKKGSVGLTVIDPFNENKNFKQQMTSPLFTQSSNFSVPFRSFGASFSYRFGTLKAAAPRKKGVTNDDVKQGEQQGGTQ